MHEQGYHYIGPTSFYKLTIQEIRRLERGCAALNKTDTGKTGPRESDWKKLKLFKKKMNLN